MKICHWKWNRKQVDTALLSKSPHNVPVCWTDSQHHLILQEAGRAAVETAAHSAVTPLSYLQRGNKAESFHMKERIRPSEITPLEEDTEPSFVSIRHRVTLKCSAVPCCLHCLFAFLLGFNKEKASLVVPVQWLRNEAHRNPVKINKKVWFVEKKFRQDSILKWKIDR